MQSFPASRRLWPNFSISTHLPFLLRSPSPWGKRRQKRTLSTVRCHSFTGTTRPVEEPLSKAFNSSIPPSSLTSLWRFRLNCRLEVENILTALHMLAPLRSAGLKLQVYFTGRGAMGRDARWLSTQTQINPPLVHDRANTGETGETSQEKIIYQIPLVHSKTYFRIRCLLKMN